MKLAAIILAAGQSSRFNNNIPKQFHYIDDDLMINHSIKKLSSINHIKEIYIALNYNKSINIFDYKKCIYPNKGCMDSNSINYNKFATISCTEDCDKFKLTLEAIFKSSLLNFL